MVEARVIHDRERKTLTIWFSDALDEFVCEETGREIVLIKDRSGHVIGVEKLHFSVPAFDSVFLETIDR